jgi:hypothetical protein
MIPAMPASYNQDTKLAMGRLCWWDDWIDAGRPSLVLNRIPTSGQVPGAPGEQRGGFGVLAVAESPRRPLLGADA